MKKRQIFIRGNAGLCHMLTSTNGAINLSEDLNKRNVECEIFHDWLAWDCWYDIFNVQHKNFAKEKLLTPPDAIEFKDVRNEISIDELSKNSSPIKITQNVQIDLKRPEEFFQIYTLTKNCLQHMQNTYQLLDSGNYAAIHCRGGDMIKVKYEHSFDLFFEKQTSRINEILQNIPPDLKILLVSDNQEILQKYVDHHKIYTTSIAYKLIEMGVQIDPLQALHCPNKSYCQNKFTEFDICFNAVQDLFLLSHSKFLYGDCLNSSFSQTAAGLQRLLQKQPQQRVL